MRQTVRRQNKLVILDFYYRNWLFSAVLWFHLLCWFGQRSNATPLVISTSSHSSTPRNSSTCSQLTDHFRFDYALNQHIHHRSGRSQSEEYHHFLVSHSRLLRFRFPSTDPVVAAEPVAAQPLFDSIAHHIGFSVWAWPDKEAASRLCFLNYVHANLTCLRLDHYGRRNLDAADTFADADLVEHHRFALPPGYYPTVAHQDVRFTELENSRYVVLFLEQTLVLDPVKPTNHSSPAVGPPASPQSQSYHYNRNFRSYMFANLDRIVDLTGTVRVPEYLESVPARLEITGVFNWKVASRGDMHEYLILVFNGTHHLWCMNDDCAHADRYRPYLTECRPTFEIDPDRAKPIQAIDHHAKLDHLFANDQAPSALDYLTDKFSVRKRQYSVYFLAVMAFLLGCIALLALGMCYYRLKELHIESRALKQMYVEQSGLLGGLGIKVDGGGGGGGEGPNSLKPSPTTSSMDLVIGGVLNSSSSGISSESQSTRRASSESSLSSTYSPPSSATNTPPKQHSPQVMRI